jgi:hypothetical protein
VIPSHGVYSPCRMPSQPYHLNTGQDQEHYSVGETLQSSREYQHRVPPQTRQSSTGQDEEHYFVGDNMTSSTKHQHPHHFHTSPDFLRQQHQVPSATPESFSSIPSVVEATLEAVYTVLLKITQLCSYQQLYINQLIFHSVYPSVYNCTF